MKINVITLFPDVIEALTDYSIVGRASEKGLVNIKTYNLRDFGIGKYKQVDDTPYGGGAGMVLKVDVIDKAIKKVREDNPGTHIVLLTPKGKKHNQKQARELSKKDNITLICGHYEGFDERIRELVDAEISIGDYILSGGELASAIIIDSIVRLIPCVLGNKESEKEESFEKNLLEYPQYTKPREYEGNKVPGILLSGDHGKIKQWRNDKSDRITKKKRPDL